MRCVLLLGLLSACVSTARIERETGGDVDGVRAAASARVGQEPPPRTSAPDDGSIDAAVREMLAGELDEATAVKVALLNNRVVRERYERLGVARAELVQAGLLRNPVFSGNAKFFGGGTEVELTLAGSFIELFYRPLRKRIAAAELEAAKAEVTRDLVALAFDVRRALVGVRAGERLVAARRTSLAAASASHGLMRSLHEAGNVTDARLTAEELGEARARLDLAAAEAASVEAREPMQVLLGIWGTATTWRVAGELPDTVGDALDLEHVESKAIAQSLDLAANRSQIEAAAQAAGLARWEGLFPALEAGVAAKRESSDGSWGLGPDLALTVPLFDQGQARRAKQVAILRERIAHHVALAVEIRSAARTYRDRVASLRDRSGYLRETYLPLRTKLLGETLANYNAMQVGAFEVLLAKQQELDAQREYVETLRLAWEARLDLEELLAGSYRAPRAMGEAEAAPSGHESPGKGH
ncbi:MAG TPA: TolC family protein [Planctomycetota bacterium]|nr:TolC family protein [Planctomycetota bacterium]